MGRSIKPTLCKLCTKPSLRGSVLSSPNNFETSRAGQKITWLAKFDDKCQGELTEVEWMNADPPPPKKKKKNWGGGLNSNIGNFSTWPGTQKIPFFDYISKNIFVLRTSHQWYVIIFWKSKEDILGLWIHVLTLPYIIFVYTFVHKAGTAWQILYFYG